jgi:ribosomal subunit interface protein
MKINIKTTGVTLTPDISDYVEKRLVSVDKFFINDPSTQCDIELARTTGHHNKGDIFRAEVHIIAKDKNIYASAEKEDLFIAIDNVRDEVLREIVTLKDKRQSVLRRSSAKIKNMIKGFWPNK